MEQDRKKGIIEAIVSVDQNLGPFEYGDKVNELLAGISFNDKIILSRETELLMRAWWNASADKPNPYARAFRYFNPASGC